jgi:anti-sigma B factor antagonist
MDYSFEKHFNPDENAWDISVTGEIDIFNSGDFKSELMDAVAQNPRNLRINCEKLKYIDSTALGSLVAVLKNVKSYQGEIFLMNLRASLIKLFKITNLDKAFVIEGAAND